MKFPPKVFFLISLNISLIVFSAVSQNPALDSLTNVLANAKEDTVKADILYYLSKETTDPAKSKEYVYKSYSLSLKLNYKKGIANNLFALGLIDYNKGDYAKALSFMKRSQGIWKELKNKSRIGDCYNVMGIISKQQGDFEKAIDYYKKGLTLQIELKDDIKSGNIYNNLANVYQTKGDYDQGLKMFMQAMDAFEKGGAKGKVYTVLNNIGLIHNNMKDYPKALEYFQQALNSPDKVITGHAYINMGNVYIAQDLFDKAEESFLKALKVYEDLDNKDGVAAALASLASNYSGLGKLEEAKNYYFKSYTMYEELGDKTKVCIITINISENYLKQKDFKRSMEYGSKGLLQAKQLGIKSNLLDSYVVLSDAYKGLGDYAKSLEYYKLSVEVKDSMFSKEKTQSIIELQTKYESDKKEKEILLLTKDNELKEREFKEQKIIRSSLIGGLILLFVLSFTLYNRYRFKQKANFLLENQKKEIQQKNIQITDSIDYAKTIQEAILPSDKAVKALFSNSFIFYKPKAIVSGDFYWVGEKDTKIICAIADCTGHGVPGAFMSLLGNNILENVIKKANQSQPAAILDSLNEGIIAAQTSGQDEGRERSSVKNGMDIALITVDKALMQLEYAGAHNSLYLIRDGKLSEIKADKMPIGFLKNGETMHFTNHIQELKMDDMIYMFSDGYVDQIGGPERKKFYYQPFKDLLTSIHKLPMDDQKKKLEEVIIAWKREYDQTDDMLIVGIKV